MNLRILSVFLSLVLLAGYTQAQAPDKKKENAENPKTDSANVDKSLQNYTLSGVVKDEANQPLVGVRVTVENAAIGAETDFDGKFSLKLPLNQKHVLHFTYTDYEEQVVEVAANQTTLFVGMISEARIGEEIVVSASRTNETVLESPVTIERMDVMTIKETPAQNMYDAAANMKGVDIISSSLGFKTLNTRGFNSPGNSRFMQRIDGMDMQIAGLNMPLGSISGSSDLDIASVELMPGTSSALYGPNAFNGLMNINTKSPFDYPGLSVMLKGGANHLDGKDANPSPMTEAALRYAKVIKKRFGFKVNLAYFMGNDWQATSRADVANYAGTYPKINPGPGNPGYDGLNVYGDEVAAVFDSTIFDGKQQALIKFLNPGLDTIPSVLIARTGYNEKDLANYDVYNAKGDVGLYYKLTEKMEISVTGRGARGRAMWMADNRIVLDNFLTYGGKVELKGENFYLRAYMSGGDAGDAYDTRFAAMNINKRIKSDTNWFAQYQAVYYGLYGGMAGQVGLPPLPAFNDSAARAFADADNRHFQKILADYAKTQPADIRKDMERFVPLLGGGARVQPGTARFDSMLAVVRGDRNFNSGARFTDRSQVYHAEGQYDFSKHFKFIEILVGGSFRTYKINSEGHVFADTAGVIWAPEFGAYTQLTKRFFKKRLRISGSARVDKTINFDMQFSPRVAAVVSLGKYRQHNFRGSFQTGFKMPDLRHRYINFSVGTYQIIGGFNDTYNNYGLVYTDAEGRNINNAYTLASLDQVLADPNATLKPYNIKAIQPEFVRTIEVGYKGALTRKIMVDLSYYTSRYNNFIGMVGFVGPSLKDAHTENVALTEADVRQRDGAGNEQFQRFRHYANAQSPVMTHGLEASLAYQLSSKLSILANYTYADILAADLGEVQTQFNTPKHKANLTLAGRKIMERFGFALNYRWTDTFYFEYSFANGQIPMINNVDAQVSYSLPKFKSSLKLGGTNLLNNRAMQVYGGPSVGTMLYLQITYDDFLN